MHVCMCLCTRVCLHANLYSCIFWMPKRISSVICTIVVAQVQGTPNGLRPLMTAAKTLGINPKPYTLNRLSTKPCALKPKDYL